MDEAIRDRLIDMRRSAEQALIGLDRASAADLRNDWRLANTVLWALSMVGEASAALPDAFLQAHPEVAFRAAKAMRNRLIHGYRSIDFDVVHDTIRLHLPALITDLDRLLAEEP